jgi:hypothetical protein
VLGFVILDGTRMSGPRGHVLEYTARGIYDERMKRRAPELRKAPVGHPEMTTRFRIARSSVTVPSGSFHPVLFSL